MRTIGKCIRRFMNIPRKIIEVVQAELPRMAVVPYSSDVLYTDKTRLQLLYTDVQQLKMIQMVSQPLYSAILLLFI